MMFKKICVFILITCILFVFNIDVYSKEVGLGVEPRDVLILYDNNLLESAHENIAAIVDTLTYIGYSACYSTIEESKGELYKFTHIVYYHEGNRIEQSFLYELSKLNNKIMVVGGGDVTDLIEMLKLPVTCNIIEDTSVQFSYSYDGEKERSMFSKSQRAVFLQGDFPYSKGRLITGTQSAALSVRMGRFSNIAAFDSNSAMLMAMFAEEIALWMWPYNNAPNKFAQYIVFDEVYPFFDTQKMMEVIESMKEKGVPYAITVMPIYQNGEYPAMKHFCEVLRYAQANGAAIFLKAPIINTNKPTMEDINKQISIAFSAYCSYGVYPVALVAPKNWIHEKMGIDVLRQFRTIVLTPIENENSWSGKDRFNTVHSDGHQIIAPAMTVGDIKENLTSAYPTALYLNMDINIEDLQKQIKVIQMSHISLKSIWSSSQSVYLKDKVLSYKNNILTLNGEVQSLEFTPFNYDEVFQYNRGIIGRMADSFNRENKRLLFFVCGISVIFIIFIVIARYQNRRRFLYNNDNSTNYKEKED